MSLWNTKVTVPPPPNPNTLKAVELKCPKYVGKEPFKTMQVSARQTDVYQMLVILSDQYAFAQVYHT